MGLKEDVLNFLAFQCHNHANPMSRGKATYQIRTDIDSEDRTNNRCFFANRSPHIDGDGPNSEGPESGPRTLPALLQPRLWFPRQRAVLEVTAKGWRGKAGEVD